LYIILTGVLGLFGLILLVIAGAAIAKKSLAFLLEPVIIGFTFFLIIFAMACGLFYVASASEHKNNLQDNLLQKYDIVAVDYESKLAPLKITESESQLITVDLKDGKQGSFLLTQNAWTNEPTLSEMPESAVSLEEITR
jgi:ABC-type transport system involved in multi-copper enzyme maturation permease subunit